MFSQISGPFPSPISVGTSSYACNCKGNWAPNGTLSYRNCIAEILPNPCWKLLCQNGGRCEVMKDRPRLARCICPSSFFGTVCDIAYSHWATWQPWQVCSTSCGPGRQVRWRPCNGSTRCPGPMVERRQCVVAPLCPEDQESGKSTGEGPTGSKQFLLSKRIVLLLVKAIFAELGISIALALLRLLCRWWLAKKMEELTNMTAEEPKEEMSINLQKEGKKE